jgi:hypothetical protein
MMLLLDSSLVEPFFFPTLTEEERQTMKTIIGGRSSLGEASLEVVRQLERVLIIHLDIFINAR